jgi:ABC-2 type transport system ATP-binding protein
MLSIDSVSKYYGDYLALSDVSFTLRPGDVVGLLGLNGAGKSTLLKGLAGEFAFSGGSVTCHGVCRSKQPLEYRRLLGYQPDRPCFPESFTVFEFARFMSRVYGRGTHDAQGQIEAWLDRLQLSSLRQAFCDELSNGEQQRLSFLGAVVHEPRVLLLDEPFNGLDPKQLGEFRRVIATCARDRIILLSSHLMSEVQLLCNRILIMERGRIVADERVGCLEDWQGVERYFSINDGAVKDDDMELASGVVV